MIIDTTKTKIERDISRKLEDINIPLKLIEAKKHSISADVKVTMRKYGHLYDGCSCHISTPPCGYCESHAECALCNEMVLNDSMVELNNDWVCEECSWKEGKAPLPFYYGTTFYPIGAGLPDAEIYSLLKRNTFVINVIV